MAISKRPIRPVALLIALMFLLTPLSPLVGAGPVDEGDRPLGPGDGVFTAVDDDETIPIVNAIAGPSDDPFAASLTNLGDVDGDGIDDMIIGSGYDYWLEEKPFAPWYGSKQYLLRGKEGRNYTTDDLEVTGNASISWFQHSERWLGDVNGDGHADLVYRINDMNVRADGDIWWEDQYKVFIHYGSEDGFALEPDLKISILPEGVEANMTYLTFQLGGVGDVNGDGFNDLFVYRHGFEIWDHGSGGGGTEPPGGGRGEDPGNGGRADDPDQPPDDKDPPEPWPEPNATYYPPDFQLFYGSEDGLPLEPSWNGTPELEARWYYLQGIHHADVNDDGHSDVILASTSAPHIQVYHGSEDGISLEPDMTVTFNTQFSYGWSLHSPVDIDGDEYDDVIIAYGQAEGLFDYVQYLYVLPGSELGIPTKPSEEYRLVLEDLSADHSPQVVMADINGDGLDDAFVYARLQTRQVESDEIRFQVHFNSGEGIPEDASWQHRYITDWTVPLLGMADHGDFDNDGYIDVAIPSPGEWVWWDDGQSEYTLGHVVIVNAGGIMELMRPLTLREGPDLYAGYKSYTFRVNVNPTGLSVLPTKAQLTLDPGGADVVLEAGLQVGGAYFVKMTDPNDLVTLTSSLDDIIYDSDNNTIWVLFKVEFDWSWPHEDMCDAKVGTVLNNITTPFLARELFWVENDLELLGDLSVSAAIQGDLEEDDWVRAGEEVTVSGPVVVYEGTVDLFPPSGVCNVVLQDNDGTLSSTANVAGEAVSLVLAMDDATDAEEMLKLTLEDLPGLATSVSEPQFRLKVDGDAPSFTNVVPGPDDWHASSQVLTGITADDGLTAGVLASSLEYSYSIDGGVTWTDWSTGNLEVTPDGLEVDGMVLLTIPDGEDNFVRWRASDLVGNGPAMSANMRIKVDTVNVTYTGAFPDPDQWFTQLQVECGVTIRDEDGAGIEATTIFWRVSHSNLSGYGEWQSWSASTGNSQEIAVSQLIDMGDSPYNYVQWKAKDIAGNGFTTSPHYKVRVDTKPIDFFDLFPDVGPHGLSTILVGANVTDGEHGSGIALSTIDYRIFTGGEWGEWMNIGMAGSSQHNRISAEATFEDGENNRVQFRGSDVAGNGPSMSDEHYLTVDTTGPEFGPVTPGADQKQTQSEVVVTITITDAIAGVMIDSGRVRFGTEGPGSMGEWTEVTFDPTDSLTMTATVTIEFLPGVDNVVEFMASDILGNEATSAVATIWVNRAPNAYIKTPTAEEVYQENEEITLNGTLSSDPDEDDTMNYTWYHDLQVEPIGHGKLLDVNLPVGVYNVTLVVTDDAGAVDQISVLVTVEEYIPPTTETSSVIWWVLLVVVLAAIMVAVFVMYRRKGDMDEWEEV
jgi:hypothetical protein